MFFFFCFFFFFFCQKSSISDFWFDYLILLIQNTQYLQILWIRESTHSQITAKKMLCKGISICYMFIGVKKINWTKVVLLACQTPIGHDTCICPTKNKLSQTVWELWPAQDFSFRGHKYIMEQFIALLHTTCLPVLIYASTKYYWDISYHLEVMEWSRRNSFRREISKQTKQELSFLHVTLLHNLIYDPT